MSKILNLIQKIWGKITSFFGSLFKPKQNPPATNGTAKPGDGK